MVDLNGMSVKTDEIMNAYIKAPCGPDEGNMVIIVRDLYGLNSAGVSFQNHFVECIQFMGYNPCLADTDLWIRLMRRSIDDFKHYEYILIYVKRRPYHRL